ncbi:MAG: hypothetical protein LKE37_00545 [Atopobiaceae bacterium]|jgi:hypothetical protein|nr:hypothetical protein [Atopobiaceae bacterium]
MPSSADIGTSREALLDRLRGQGLIVGDGSAFGMPIPTVEPGHEPQGLLDANRQQRAIVTCSYSVPWPGPQLCAAWVERVVEAAGFGFYLGSARDLYERDCALSDTSALKVGMAVAVPRTLSPGLAANLGHVGLYIGDGLVRESVDEAVRTVPLELWLVAYGLMDEPRWGWLGGLAL